MQREKLRIKRIRISAAAGDRKEVAAHDNMTAERKLKREKKKREKERGGKTNPNLRHVSVGYRV